ncbi:MAG: hypothetical protein CBC35_00370 [Planctomycetes bacterium TMED75]|nr:hypothetical protein [Planctomycetaceae bacterium]OUU96905.1 MAG: hypothetical protein CBC35_00370 [Planctomycetes bacterium TMED75]
MRIPRVDLVLFPVVLLIGILVGSVQVAWMPGVPEHGRYHPSDMDDLQEQLLGHAVLPKPYAAASDHPAWITICGMYQTASAATGLRGMQLWNLVTPGLLGVNLCLFMGLARQLRFTRWLALSLTAVFLASGATITWSVVLETHVLAPTGLLLTALILTNRRFTSQLWGRPTPEAIAIYGLAIALAASITITNLMLAILAVLPVNLFRQPRPVRLAHRTMKRFPTLMTAFLVGIGLLAFVHLTGWYLTQDRDMRQFLEVLVRGGGDRLILLQGIPGSRWESILALAWIAPPLNAYIGSPEALDLLVLDRTWSTAPAYLSGLIVLLLTICSLWVVSARTMFIPAFVLFGVVLHSVYGLGESFLFSANYTWATVLSIGLLVRTVAPRQLGWITVVLATALFIVNILIWKDGIAWIIEYDYILQPAN